MEETKAIFIIYVFIIIISILAFIFSTIRYSRKIGDFKIKMSGAIFDSSKEAVIITDKDTKILYANKAFTEITGVEANEVIGKYPSDFKSGRHDDEFYKQMWDSLNTKGSWSGEVWDKKKNEELYLKQLTIRAVETDTDDIYYIGIFEDLTPMKEKEEIYEKQKRYDFNTELPNHIRLSETIENYINSRKTTILIIIKIANYMPLNNNLGYTTGALLINQASERIKQCISESEQLFLSDKDEFAVLTDRDIDIVNEYCIKKINEMFNKPFIANRYKTYFKIIGGISIINDFSKSSEYYIQSARIALFAADTDKKQNFIIYSDYLRQYYNKMLKVQMLLKDAISNNEFVLFYQPQVRVKDKKVLGAEALIRWENKELGFVSPGDFINIAEQDDTIVRLGSWVIEEAIKQKNQWNKIGLNDFVISINISPNQFIKSDLYENLKDMLRKYHLDGEEIEIEVTEDLLINDKKFITYQLNRIKQLGIKIAIDDFGTGYASLQYLKELPIDKIKIDREFIKDIPNKDDGTIAKIIVSLAHELNIIVIAEGIETEEQKNYIEYMGCDQIQGYFYSSPLVSNEFIKWYNKFNKNI